MFDLDNHSFMDEYLSGHKEMVKAEEKFLIKRKQLAREKVELLARELSRIFSIHRIYLFGSLTDGYFRSHSDIDIAIEGLDVQYHLKAFTVAEEIVRPFRLDMVVLEEATPYFQNKVRKRGVVAFEQGTNKCLSGTDC